MKKILILILLSSINIIAQFKLDDWEAHTSMLDVQSVCIDSSHTIWVATIGGVFSYDLSGKYNQFRNINEMFSINITEIEYDKQANQIITGSSDGIIEFYDYDDWVTISDIYTSAESASKRINDIKIVDDLIYVGGDFGLAVLNRDEKIFEYNVTRFGEFAQSSINEIVITSDTIWLATNQGIAFAEKNDFLSNPAVWKNISIDSGFQHLNITEIVYVDNHLYALEESGIYVIDDLNALSVKEGLFFGIEKYNNELVYAGYSRIKGLDNSDKFLSDNIIKNFEIEKENEFLIYTLSSGLQIVEDDNQKVIAPLCPISNRIEDMEITSNGEIWFGTGDDRSGKGIMMYDGKTWTNFSKFNREDQISNAYHRILVTSDDRVYASGWGPGYLQIHKTDTGYAFENYTTENTDLIGISKVPDFLAMGGIEEDLYGNVWVVSLAGAGQSGPFMGCNLKETNETVPITNVYSPTNRNFFSLGIDNNNTKWVGGAEEIGYGLLYYNDNGTIKDQSDDIAGLISASDIPELSSNYHYAIEADNSGLVWIGMPTGLSVLLNPEAVIFDTEFVFREVDLVGSVLVNDIYIDKLNNKWIATNEGVVVLNSDGSEVLGRINNDNSPIPTEEILSVLVNPNNGRAYFGTDNGVYSAISLSAEPLVSYDINCYPQPFNTNTDSELIIDGLASDSYIKIVTTSGDYINELRTKGRKAIWDGRDENGNLVKPGVYLIIAESISGNKSGTAKVAVIRK